MDAITDPEQFQAEFWQLLHQATTDPANDFRWPILAYQEADASLHQRSVVLRGCDKAMRRLDFFTDMRSLKVRALQNGPASMLFVNRLQGLQIAFSGQAHVHEPRSAHAQAAFATLSKRQLSDYAIATAPGLPTTDTLAADQRDIAHAENNFAVVCFTCATVDCLRLGAPTLRVKGLYGDSGANEDRHFQGSWVTP